MTTLRQKTTHGALWNTPDIFLKHGVSDERLDERLCIISAT